MVRLEVVDQILGLSTLLLLKGMMYLDMMESVLGNSSKVMLDVQGSNNLLYLPLDKLMSRSVTTDNLGDSLNSLTQQQDLLRQVQQQTQRNRSNLRTRETR